MSHLDILQGYFTKLNYARSALSEASKTKTYLLSTPNDEKKSKKKVSKKFGSIFKK